MSDHTQDFQLTQTQDDVISLADKIKRSKPEISRNDAWIQAVRMLGSMPS